MSFFERFKKETGGDYEKARQKSAALAQRKKSLEAEDKKLKSDLAEALAMGDDAAIEKFSGRQAQVKLQLEAVEKASVDMARAMKPLKRAKRKEDLQTEHEAKLKTLETELARIKAAVEKELNEILENRIRCVDGAVSQRRPAGQFIPEAAIVASITRRIDSPPQPHVPVPRASEEELARRRGEIVIIGGAIPTLRGNGAEREEHFSGVGIVEENYEG